MELSLIGIGSGNPEHLTLQAIRVLNEAELVLIPRKGEDKKELADIRRRICDTHLVRDDLSIAEFDLPVRDPAIADYLTRVERWHDAIAQCWSEALDQYPDVNNAVLLIWGDPMLYDSSLRIAGRLADRLTVQVIPGITSLQALCAAHAIPLNEAGQAVQITTGRKLRDEGWPQGANTLAIMLDGENSFQHIDPAGVHIWWGACLSMPQERILEGPLAETGSKIIECRKQVRADLGWVMDMYILRRDGAAQ